MTAWDDGAHLDQAQFAARFFDREADDPIVAKLRDAAGQASDAKNHTDLSQASESLAGAQKLVGMDRWHRFLADARSLLTNPTVLGGALVVAGSALALTGIGAVPGAATASAGGAVLSAAGALAVTDAAAVAVGAAAVGVGTVVMNAKQTAQGGADTPKLTRGGGKKQGSLKGTGIEDKSVTDAILSRGGTGSNVNEVSTDLRQLSVAEVANRAAQGNEYAEKALKIIKEAARLGQKYR
jgi:hypothetical protein